MARLRRVHPDSSGWTRRRQGKGFVYLDQQLAALGPEDVARCRSLVIPPAWTQVWICPSPNGHIQAVGTDDAGRRQYLYHPVWREQRDRAKHDRVLIVARRLPQARKVVATHVARPGMPRERALGTAFRLLDLGFFRVGGEQYAEDNGTFGLATIEKQHVHIAGNEVVFDYPAKSGRERLVAVADPAVIAAVSELRARRGGGRELLAFRDGTRWRDLTSTDINRYVKEVVGGEVRSRQRVPSRKAVRAAMVEVAEYLGNTPTVARGSYVDPRLIDAYESGTTIAPTLAKLGRRRRDAEQSRDVIERAVLRLLRD